MEFETKKRLLTKEEKLRRAIFFYTYEDFDFDLEYEEGNDFDEHGQPLVKIEENINKLDDKTKALVYEFAEREILTAWLKTKEMITTLALKILTIYKR